MKKILTLSSSIIIALSFSSLAAAHLKGPDETTMPIKYPFDVKVSEEMRIKHPGLFKVALDDNRGLFDCVCQGGFSNGAIISGPAVALPGIQFNAPSIINNYTVPRGSQYSEPSVRVTTSSRKVDQANLDHMNKKNDRGLESPIIDPLDLTNSTRKGAVEVINRVAKPTVKAVLKGGAKGATKNVLKQTSKYGARKVYENNANGEQENPTRHLP